MTKPTTMRTNITRMPPDYYGSFTDSKILANRIESYWHNKGYRKVRAWVETETDVNSGRKIFNVRSNIEFNVKDAEVGNYV